MDLRKERKILSTATALLMISVAAVLILGLIKLSGKENPGSSDADEGGTGIQQVQSDKDAKDGTLPGFEATQEKNPEDILTYRINSKPYFKKPDAKGDLSIENPIENQYLMQVELELYDTGEVVYKTGYLKPGQYIDEAQLDDTELEKGVYETLVWIYAIDPDTLDPVGSLEENITLYIGEKKPGE